MHDPYDAEYLKKLDLKERQINAIHVCKKNGRITNIQYQEQFSVSKKTASVELKALVEHGLLIKHGKTGKGTFYELKPKG